MRRPGPVRRRDYAWAAAAGVLLAVHVVGILGYLVAIVVVRTAAVLLWAPIGLSVSVLQAYWLVCGCWRRTFWGRPTDAQLAEAAQALTRRQHRSLTVFTAAGLACALALGCALAAQLLAVR